MTLKPIIIDFATIFDPARLIAVLAAVDVRYSEVWVPQAYDIWKEKDFLTGFGTDRIVELLPRLPGAYRGDPFQPPDPAEKLDPKNYMTGPRILTWALREGRAVPKDLSGQGKLGSELMALYGLERVREAIILDDPDPGLLRVRAGSSFKEEWVNTPDWQRGIEWRLEPYGVGIGIGHMLAAQALNEAEPFFSHPFFADGITSANYNYFKRSEALKHPAPPVSPLEASLDTARTILVSPENVSIEDVAFYLGQRERINAIQGIITASEQIQAQKEQPGSVAKDCGVIVSKFGVTYALDAFVFGGVPVSSLAVSVYDVAARILKPRKKD